MLYVSFSLIIDILRVTHNWRFADCWETAADSETMGTESGVMVLFRAMQHLAPVPWLQLASGRGDVKKVLSVSQSIGCGKIQNIVSVSQSVSQSVEMASHISGRDMSHHSTSAICYSKVIEIPYWLNDYDVKLKRREWVRTDGIYAKAYPVVILVKQKKHKRNPSVSHPSVWLTNSVIQAHTLARYQAIAQIWQQGH